MNNIELNKMIVKYFPILENNYQDEVDWQEGDATGSHTVFGDVFTPYFVKCIESKKNEELYAIFNFLELLLSIQDKYIDEVVAFSVFESVGYLLNENKEIIDMMGSRTKKMVEEL